MLWWPGLSDCASDPAGSGFEAGTGTPDKTSPLLCIPTELRMEDPFAS